VSGPKISRLPTSRKVTFWIPDHGLSPEDVKVPPVTVSWKKHHAPASHPLGESLNVPSFWAAVVAARVTSMSGVSVSYTPTRNTCGGGAAFCALPGAACGLVIVAVAIIPRPF
jgi:hypothetical protein